MMTPPGTEADVPPTLPTGPRAAGSRAARAPNRPPGGETSHRGGGGPLGLGPNPLLLFRSQNLDILNKHSPACV